MFGQIIIKFRRFFRKFFQKDHRNCYHNLVKWCGYESKQASFFAPFYKSWIVPKFLQLSFFLLFVIKHTPIYFFLQKVICWWFFVFFHLSPAPISSSICKFFHSQLWVTCRVSCIHQENGWRHLLFLN